MITFVREFKNAWYSLDRKITFCHSRENVTELVKENLDRFDPFQKEPAISLELVCEHINFQLEVESVVQRHTAMF
jgi:hypothetical protein